MTREAPVITVTKSQLLKLAFDHDNKYRDQFVEWLREKISDFNVTPSLGEPSSSSTKPTLFELALDPSKNNRAIKIIRLRIQQLIMIMDPVLCIKQLHPLLWKEMSIDNKWKSDLGGAKDKLPSHLGFMVKENFHHLPKAAQNGDDTPFKLSLKELFRNSSQSSYLSTIEDVLRWLLEINSDIYSRDNRVRALPIVLDKLIYRTERMINQSRPPKNANDPAAPESRLTTEENEQWAKEHFAPAEDLLDSMKKCKMQIVNLYKEDFNSDDMSESFRYFLFSLINSLKDQLSRESIKSELQEAIRDMSTDIKEMINALDDSFIGANPRDKSTIDAAYNAFEMARDKFQKIVSNATSIDRYLESSLINIHIFEFTKILKSFPSFERIKNKSHEEIRNSIMIIIYQLGILVENLKRQYDNIDLAKQYITEQKGKYKNDARPSGSEAKTLYYTFQPKVKKMIDRIITKERNISQRTSGLDNLLPDSTFQKMDMSVNIAAQGIDAESLDVLNTFNKEQFDASPRSPSRLHNAFLAVLCQYFIRQLSRYFVIVDQNTYQRLPIDFRLYENDLEIQPKYTDKSEFKFDKILMMTLKLQYTDMIKDRRDQNIKLYLFKIIYQKYFLPFHYLTVTRTDGQVQKYDYVMFPKYVFRVKDIDSRIVYLMTGSSLTDIVDDKSLSLENFNFLLEDPDVVAMKKFFKFSGNDYNSLLPPILRCCIAVFQQTNSALSAWSNIDTSDALTGKIVPNVPRLQRPTQCFDINSFELACDRFPVDATRKLMDQVAPYWYTDYMTSNFLLEVLTDETYLRRRGTLEKFYDNVKNIISGGADPEASATQDADYSIKVVTYFLSLIDTFLTTPGADILYEQKLNGNDERLIEKIIPHLKHLVAQSKMDPVDFSLLSKQIQGLHTSPKPILAESYTNDIINKYAKIIRDNTADKNERATDFGVALKKLGTIYGIPNLGERSSTGRLRQQFEKFVLLSP